MHVYICTRACVCGYAYVHVCQYIGLHLYHKNESNHTANTLQHTATRVNTLDCTCILYLHI